MNIKEVHSPSSSTTREVQFLEELNSRSEDSSLVETKIKANDNKLSGIVKREYEQAKCTDVLKVSISLHHKVDEKKFEQNVLQWFYASLLHKAGGDISNRKFITTGLIIIFCCTLMLLGQNNTNSIIDVWSYYHVRGIVDQNKIACITLLEFEELYEEVHNTSTELTNEEMIQRLTELRFEKNSYCPLVD